MDKHTNGNGNGNGKGILGMIAGSASIGTFIFSSGSWVPWVFIDFVLKLLVTAVSGAIIGLAGVFVVDLYRHRWKHRIFKNKHSDNGRSEKDKAA